MTRKSEDRYYERKIAAQKLEIEDLQKKLRVATVENWQLKKTVDLASKLALKVVKEKEAQLVRLRDGIIAFVQEGETNDLGAIQSGMRKWGSACRLARELYKKEAQKG